MGKAPCRPFSGLRVSCGGVLVTPGLGERALDQAQDDLMGKKCPQEEYQALTAKTSRTYHSLSLLISLLGQGRGLWARWALVRDSEPEGGTLVNLTPLSLNLVVSVSHRLCLSLSLYLYL